MRIITSNVGDSGTITASPAAVATLPAINLQNATRAPLWRSTSVADQTLNLTWSSVQLLSAVALLRHNLTSAATWRIQVFSDAAWTTVVYDSGAVAAYTPKSLGEIAWGLDALGASVFTAWSYFFSAMYFTPVAGQSMSITLSDPTNPAGYMQASRLFAGAYFEPTFNADYGLSLTWKEDTVLTRTDGGTLRSDPKEPYRNMKFDLSMLQNGEDRKLVEIIRSSGKRKDIFISIFPGVGGAQERDYTMQAKLVTSPNVVAAAFNLYSGKSIELEEA